MERMDLEADWLERKEEREVTKENPMLIGKVVTTKNINRSSIWELILRDWRLKRGVAINDLGDNRFIFLFNSEEKRSRVMRDSPWTVSGALLVLKEWSPALSLQKVRFDRCMFWVQLGRLPFPGLSKEMLIKLGSRIGTVVECEDPWCHGRLTRPASFGRVRVMVNLNRPLVEGVRTRRLDGLPSWWIAVKYEKLGDFCYQCGTIEHDQPNCEFRRAWSMLNPLEHRYGPGLRAAPCRAISDVISLEHAAEDGGRGESTVARDSMVNEGRVVMEVFLLEIHSSKSSTVKQMVMNGDMPFLPEEIMTSIFKRLPVKSLIQCQCVCKHWKNLIQSPSFIKDHLHHSSHQNTFILFERDHPLDLHLLDCKMQIYEVQNTPLIDSLKRAKIVGSSYGLLCVEMDEYSKSPRSLLLWNPAMKKVKQVPKTINHFDGYCRLGFGFSSIVNDYKIVRTYAKPIYAIIRVEVYSLNIGLWKEIEFGNLESVRLFESVTVDGAIFWWGIKRGAGEEGEDVDLIVSFDIAVEVFTLIPWPTSLMRKPWPTSNSHTRRKTQLTVYKNKLAMLSALSHVIYGDVESCWIEFWVMEERIGASGERWTWSKMYTSSLCPCSLDPRTILGNEVVCYPYNIEENDKTKMVLYLLNRTTNEFRRLAIGECDYNEGGIFNYAECLASFDNVHVGER